MKVKPYIQLMRPANIVTAIADVLAGYAIAFHKFQSFDITHSNLIIATVGLYGGGVVLNDVFDAKLDAVERPERPIPLGTAKLSHAKLLGFLLLIAGCLSAFLNHSISGMIAIGIAVLALLYNKYSKHYSLLGPINMGMCRGGNLLLGISANPEMLTNYGYLAVISVIYIAAVTMVSRGEVNGSNLRTLYAGGMLYLVVIFAQLYVAYNSQQLAASFFLLLVFSFFIFRPLIKAITHPVGSNIAKAVKSGVISLILMDAAWCMTFGYPLLGLFTVVLLPVSIYLSKIFAVT